MVKVIRNPDINQSLKLLRDSNLPTSDLVESNFKHFMGIEVDDELVGLVGIEIYEDVALLRSLVVSSQYRNKGIGIRLVGEIEHYAKVNGVCQLYLLTDTANVFFKKLGYKQEKRESAPFSIKSTKEFSSLCPDTSEFMVRNLET